MIASLLVSMVVIGSVQQHGAPGQLHARPDREGGPARVLPLLNTSVTADIAGIAARVTVVQTFFNPYETPVEAVYTFPLRSGAAVDRMRMKVGDRTIEGKIKRTEEARKIYEAAKAAGQTAALLDQQRPNIFTQSVANIMPGSEVQIEISYVDVLEFKDGEFEFVFPMVVGPRNPMNADDPDKIVPPILPVGVRPGLGIELSVSLDAGAPLEGVRSQLHAIDVRRTAPGKFKVALSRRDEIPNRDFILRWRPGGDGLTETFLTHTQDGKGTFCLTILPPKTLMDSQVRPREMIFVMDQSGSQSGFPIEKSKELTIAMIDKLRPRDRFNVVTFTTGVNFLWPEPMPNTMARVREAKQFVRGLTAGGGTNFIPPLTATLKDPPRDGRLKMVVFNSDGYVGDDFDILNLVRNNRRNARLFTFGIGNSVNRFLIENMGAEGRGASEIVTLGDDADAAAKRFVERTRSPVLTDIQVRVEGGRVHGLTPEHVPDMFSHGPLVLFGRYDKPGPAKIKFAGRLGGRPWSRTIDVVFPAVGDSGEGVTKAWARQRMDDMVRKNWLVAADSVRNKKTSDTDPEPIILFALEHGLMSQWTSFVAVEKRVVNVGGVQKTIEVPVAMAAGVTMGDTRLALRSAHSRPALYSGYAVTAVTRGSTQNRARGGATTGGGGAGAAAINTGVIAGYRYGGRFDTELSEMPKVEPKTKIAKALLTKKSGWVEVEVHVEDWSQDLQSLLNKAGLIDQTADQDTKTVTGTVRVENLMKLAKLLYVNEIGPLKN